MEKCGDFLNVAHPVEKQAAHLTPAFNFVLMMRSSDNYPKAVGSW